jgi:hypothetical protein
MASTYALIAICVVVSIPGILIAAGVLAFGAGNPRNWAMNSSMGMLNMSLGVLYILYLAGVGAIVALVWPVGGVHAQPFQPTAQQWVFLAGCIAALLLELIFFNDPKRLAPRGILLLPFAAWAGLLWWRSDAG